MPGLQERAAPLCSRASLLGGKAACPGLGESLRKPNRFWNQNWESRPPTGPACRNLTPSVLWSRPSPSAPAAHLSQVSTRLAGCEHRVLNNPLAPTTPSRSWSRNSGLEVVEEGGLASQRNEFLSCFRGQREKWASDGPQKC